VKLTGILGRHSASGREWLQSNPPDLTQLWRRARAGQWRQRIYRYTNVNWRDPQRQDTWIEKNRPVAISSASTLSACSGNFATQKRGEMFGLEHSRSSRFERSIHRTEAHVPAILNGWATGGFLEQWGSFEKAISFPGTLRGKRQAALLLGALRKKGPPCCYVDGPDADEVNTSCSGRSRIRLMPSPSKVATLSVFQPWRRFGIKKVYKRQPFAYTPDWLANHRPPSRGMFPNLLANEAAILRYYGRLAVCRIGSVAEWDRRRRTNH